MAELTDEQMALLAREMMRIRREDNQASKLESAARGVRDTLSFGFDDEAISAAESGLGLWGDYDAALEENRLLKERAQADNPVSFMAGQVAGAVVPAIASGGTSALANAGRAAFGAGNLSASAGVGRAALQGMGFGMGQGAVYGFGSGEGGLDNRMATGGVGALTGAIGGTAGGALGQVAGAAIQKGAKLAGNATSAIQNRISGAFKASAPERAAARQVAGMVDEAGLVLDDVISGVAPGRPMAAQSGMLADQAASVSRVNRGTRDEIKAAANKAFETAKADVEVTLKNELKGEENAVRWLLRHKMDMRQRGDKAYTEAFDKAAEMPFEQIAWLERQINVFPEIYKRAQEQGGKKSLVTMVTDPATGEMKFRVPPTFADAELIRRGLQDAVDIAFDAKRTGKATNLKGIRDELRAAIDAGSPEIAAVRAQYGTDKAIGDAFDYGKSVFSDGGKPADLEEVVVALEGMSDAEMAAFSKGVWSRIRKGLGGKKDSSTAVLGNLFDTPDGREILKLSLGDAAAEEIFKKAGVLDDAANLAYQVSKGSDTARRAADDRAMGMAGDAKDLAAAAGSGDAMGMIGSVVSFGKRLFANPPSDEQMAAAARLLLSEDPDYVRVMMEAANAGDKVAVENLKRAIQRATQATGNEQGRTRAPLELTIDMMDRAKAVPAR